MYSIFITLYKFEEKLDKTKPSKAKDTFKICPPPAKNCIVLAPGVQM